MYNSAAGWIRSRIKMPRRDLLDMLGPSSSVLDIISAADGRRPMETLPEDNEAVEEISEKGIHSLPPEILTMVMIKTFSKDISSL